MMRSLYGAFSNCTFAQDLSVSVDVIHRITNSIKHWRDKIDRESKGSEKVAQIQTFLNIP